MTISTHEHRGHEIVRVSSEALAADVLPGRGGDILQATWLPSATGLLWQSPWGVRAKGGVPTAADSVTNILEHYPGGWQTVFPNGGAAVEAHGVPIGFHGEAWLAPWEWREDGGAVEMTTRLVRCPFRLTKRVAIDGGRLTVTETAVNEGAVAYEAMWAHHPAFGAPFLDGTCRIEVTAERFTADDEFVSTGLGPGEAVTWPGSGLDAVPAPGAKVARLGALTGLTEGRAAIVSGRLGLRAELAWDLETFPSAWMWLDAAGTDGFPMFGSGYVLAVEPASTVPLRGMDEARRAGGSLLSFAPGEARTVSVSLTVTETGTG